MGIEQDATEEPSSVVTELLCLQDMSVKDAERSWLAEGAGCEDGRVTVCVVFREA